MKGRLILMLAFFAQASFCFGQENSTWEKWAWLMGEWKGEGSGQPGQGTGTFSFSFDLNKKIILRKSHSEYPCDSKQT